MTRQGGKKEKQNKQNKTQSQTQMSQSHKNFLMTHCAKWAVPNPNHMAQCPWRNENKKEVDDTNGAHFYYCSWSCPGSASGTVDSFVFSSCFTSGNTAPFFFSEAVLVR